jgi:hypothetical protein
MMSAARSALFAGIFLLAGMSDAFAPVNTPSTATSSTTSLQFGFLKELGLEKPSWLPDFGGKKEEEEAPAPAAVETESEETEESAEADDASEE